MYEITYLNNYDYLMIFTGSVTVNKPDRMLINVNNEGLFVKIYKENIIDFKPIKLKD